MTDLDFASGGGATKLTVVATTAVDIIVPMLSTTALRGAAPCHHTIKGLSPHHSMRLLSLSLSLTHIHLTQLCIVSVHTCVCVTAA